NELHYHAKCMKKLFHSAKVPTFNYTQDDLNELAKSLIMKRISVPGVQPKLSLHLEKGDAAGNSRLTLVGLEGDYILKPQTPQWKFLPEAEHFCMLFARLCKIATAEFGLIPLQSGELAYITRRMDRNENGALHMEDFCQLTNKLTSQKYNGSMEQIGKALRIYSSTPGLDAVRFLELSLFCYLTGNSDMHLKNFSLLRLADGRYEFTPAYDLVPVKILLPADNEELALTMCGKKSNLKYADFASFADNLGLTVTQFEKTLKNLQNNSEKTLSEALKRSFMPLEMQQNFKNLFLERLGKLSSAKMR
ncbi:MAG: HipA domain-containing protein, partial [Victivallaceae bacterium]